MATKSFPNGIERRNASPVLLTGQDNVTSTTARTVAVTPDGAVAAAGVAAESGGVATLPAGVTARIPEAYTYEYDAVLGLTMTFTPYINGLSVGLSDTGAETVTLLNDFITVTVDGAATTDVTLAATWAASDAAEVCGLTIDAGTVPLAATYGPQDLWTERTVSAAAMVGMTRAGTYLPAIIGDDGAMASGIADPTTGDPVVPQGVTGRLTKDLTFTISAGNDIVIHPKQGGVSVIVATAAAAAVSATGKVVTLTSKNDDTTDVAAMNVLIAASAAVSALIGPLQGTAGDLFDHLLLLAETPLWENGTIPANALIALDSSGYWSPVEMDTSGGIKMSMTSLIAGEDITAGRLKVMPKCATGSGGILVASGTGHNAACVVHRVMIAETGGANPITVLLRDGGAGGTVKTPTFTVAASGSVTHELNTAHGTDVYITCGGAGTPSVCVNVHSG